MELKKLRCDSCGFSSRLGERGDEWSSLKPTTSMKLEVEGRWGSFRYLDLCPKCVKRVFAHVKGWKPVEKKKKLLRFARIG